MNRSILIVICDFLLVSLLVFSSVDINKVAEEGRTLPIKVTLATNHVDAGADLTAVMKLALADEQKRRESLQGELARTRETAGEREKQLQSVEQRLQTTEQQRQTAAQALQKSEQQLQTIEQRLQTAEEQRQVTEQQRAVLQQQFAAARTNIETLSQQVRISSTDALISQEKLAAMEAELRKRAEEAAALQQRMTQLARSNEAALSEKQQLASQLLVAEVEKRHAAEQVVAMREEVNVERAEKAKLAEGVRALATNSTQLAQEIRENRPLTPNTLFDEFVASRVSASFNASRPGLFDANRRKETGTVLVSNGTNTYAVCHVEDTPFTFWIPGAQWDSLTGQLGRGAGQVPIRSVSFLFQDPRIVFVPVSAAEAQELGGKIYRISSTPFKFQDAVLVGAGEAYYGECRFEIDLSAPGYLKLDRNLLRGLFGKFNPSRGDLVFSRTGEFLGVMANSTYCLLLQSFEATATFNFGPDVRAQNTGNTLAALYSVVKQMPLKLQ